jgi:hypothetical protein
MRTFPRVLWEAWKGGMEILFREMLKTLKAELGKNRE